MKPREPAKAGSLVAIKIDPITGQTWVNVTWTAFRVIDGITERLPGDPECDEPVLRIAVVH
jgi:hypothetical protein